MSSQAPNKRASENILSNVQPSFRNYCNYLASGWSAFRSGGHSFKPYRLQIEPSGACNLKCVMCPQSQISDNYYRKLLKLERFKEVYDAVQPSIVDFTGQGEPLLNKQTWEMIAYATRHGSATGMVTNATLLTLENFKRLDEAGLDFLGISFDSCVPETYERIRVGAKFQEVVDNIRAAVEYSQSHPSKTSIQLGTIVNDLNYTEVEAIKRFVQETFHGVTHNYSPQLTYSLPELVSTQQGPGISEEKRQAIALHLKQVIDRYQHEAGSFTHSALVACCQYYTHIDSLAHEPCFMPYINLMVYANGETLPCCYMPYNPGMSLGNIMQQSVDEIWKSDKMVRFRQALRDHREKIPPCEICRYASQREYAAIQGVLKYMPFLRGLSNRRFD